MCQVPCKMLYILSSHAHNKCISIKPESSFFSLSVLGSYALEYELVHIARRTVVMGTLIYLSEYISMSLEKKDADLCQHK